MNPKISVVIPVRNSENTIKECLNSVINQTYNNFEIIIIDNASTDSTSEILDRYSKNLKISVFSEASVGRGAARNLGTKKAKGELIAMIDSDCIAPNNWLEEISRPIIKNGENIVMGGEISIANNYVSRNIQKLNEELIIDSMNGKYVNHLDTKNIIFNKEVLHKYSFDSVIKSCEDFDLFLRIKKDYKIMYLENVKVEHLHKINFFDWITTQIDRSFEVSKIREKIKDKHIMLESFGLFNLIKLPFWLLYKLFSNPASFAFVLVSEISWRLGILAYFLDKIGLYKYDRKHR
jgi:glycosyltransferase involved in cell wall biosynthesis